MTAADPSTSDEDEVTIGQLDVKPGAALADEEKAGTSPQLLSRDSPAGKRGTASPATPIEDPEPPPFPEGGYGWVAVFCMFMIQFFVVGITNSVGIFTGYFVGSATFPGSANTILAFSSTLGTAGMNLYGPLTGPLAERLTYRVAACTGAIFLAAGGVIMSFANQVWTLFLASIVAGFGYSCLIGPAVALPAHYFRNKLGLAIGIGMSGVGFGGVVITPVTQALLEKFGWRWAARGIAIVAGLVLFCVGLLMRMRLPRRTAQTATPVVDRSMFTNLTYWRLATMCFFTPGAFLGPFLFVPQIFADLGPLANGLSAALCLALLNGFTAIGQISAGVAMARLGKYNIAMVTTFGAVISFFPVYLLSVAKSGVGLIIFAVLNGLFGGPFPVLISNLAADRFGQHNFAAKIGMVFFWFAPGILLAGPVLGMIADSRSTFDAAGARVSTEWLGVVAYGGCCQAVVFAMALWLRLEKAGLKMVAV